MFLISLELDMILFFRYKTHPLSTGGWEEYQCWWSQTRSGPGAGGMRICSAVSWGEEYQLIQSLGVIVWSATDIPMKWSQNKNTSRALMHCSDGKPSSSLLSLWFHYIVMFQSDEWISLFYLMKKSLLWVLDCGFLTLTIQERFKNNYFLFCCSVIA